MTTSLGETHQPIAIQAGAHGTLRGVNIVAADGHVKCRRFCGVPFAQPPVGDLRWRKPLPLPDNFDWSNIAGEEFGNVTAQPSYEITNDKGEKVNFDPPAGIPMSEDALTCNIWTPAGTPPPGGWPVFIFIHGGWLQIGNPGMWDKSNPTDLLDGVLNCVVIQPAYRLSLFGFLASKELQAENEDGTAGTFGLWDQRLAIEWAAQNASIFGGNNDNITIGGLSAGSYSVEVQLAYELLTKGVKPLIKRAMMWSNALPAQPKTVEESQAAFDGVLEACSIPLDLSGEEKMRRLRAVPTEELRSKIMKLKIHTFRAVSDDAFISSKMYEDIESGVLAKAFSARGMSLIIGEVTQEELMYGATNPPKSLADLRTQLLNYYREEQVNKLLAAFEVSHETPTTRLREVFGEIVAHGQVYITARDLARSLLAGGVDPKRLLRYRCAWLSPAIAKDSLWPNGVTHADDQPMWWYSLRYGLTPEDETVARAWLKPLQAFLDGDEDDAAKQWYAGETNADGKRMREVRAGKIDVVADDRWDRCEKLAKAIAV